MTEFSTSLKNKLCCADLTSCFGCADPLRVLSPAQWADVKNFFHTHAPHLDVPLIHQELLGWRTRAKLAVRGTQAQPQIGLFKEGTHEVVSLAHCPLHHSAINRAYDIIFDTMKHSRVTPYCEKTHTGLLRYLQFVVERKTRRIQLTLVLNETKENPLVEKWVKQLYMQAGFHSIWINFQPVSTNTIFGNQWKLCEGEPYTQEQIADAQFYFHPACFMQAHLSLFEKLVRSIQQHILPNKNVVDLYSGVGVIGLNLVEKSRKVTCIEINPFASECFDLSRLRLSPPLQKKAFFHQGNVDAYQQIIHDAEVIIVDPPRKGLDAKVLQAIIASDAEQLIYISCNPLSFFNDCLELIEKGWTIAHAECYLLFPGSDHVELLCVLERKSR